MNNKMSLSLKAKLYSGLLCLGIMAGGLGLKATQLISQNETALSEIRSSYDLGATAVLPIVRTTVAMQLDVTQVQQYLSDISATQGLDDLDDGFKLAEESAAEFEKHASDALALAQRLKDAKLVAAINASSASFSPFYEAGKKMAQAYVVGGPASGNLLMKNFDEQADNIRNSLAGLLALVDKVSAAQNDATSGAIGRTEIAFESERALGGVAAALLAAFIIGLAIFLRLSLLTPILLLAAGMRKLADGNFDVSLPGLGRNDEIGGIANAVEEFKTQAINKAARDAEQKQKEQHAAETQRKALMLRLADQFQTTVGGIIDTVTSASKKLESAASTLTNTAESTQQLSGMVASASELTSANVQGVAAASEQLSSTVTEISRQVQESSTITSQAVEQAQQTNQSVAELSQSADRIGDVVRLINDIAGQTNLLALNATIEAARAGDAGKGFAVVAQEVKALATQTSKATSDIGAQITSMQSATRHAVDAIQGISATIGKINEIAGAIAAAVEQQGATTREISRNVLEAAKGTSEVALSITEVSNGAIQTGSASSEVLASAKALSSESGNLNIEVDRFLANVRAA